MSVDYNEMFLEEKIARAREYAENLYTDEDETFCEICGRHFTDEDDLTCGVCDDCIAEADFERCLEVNGDETESIEINSLVISLLDESEINNILIQHLREANKLSPLDCSHYKDSDKSWFAERLKGVR